MDYDLYVITMEVLSLGRNHLDVAKAALEGGAKVIQFREKDKTTAQMFEIASNLRVLTNQYQAHLLLNDRLDIALAVQADGIHLGREDLPLPVARRVLGWQKVIGATVRNVQEAIRAQIEGASYLGVGPIYQTPSKADAGPPIGLEVLTEIKKAVQVPVVAIGGITGDNLKKVLEAGADGVAVISAVAGASDMSKATADLLAKIRQIKTSYKDQDV